MKHLRWKRCPVHVEPTDMTSINSISQILQQGLTNPEYLRILNKSYPTKRKDSKGMLVSKESLKQELLFVEKLTISGSLLSMV